VSVLLCFSHLAVVPPYSSLATSFDDMLAAYSS
jgi:hypothetical protein